MFKHRLVVFCSIVTVLAILLAGCAPQQPAAPEGAAAGEEAAAPAGGVAVAPAGEFPIVSEPITIEAFICGNTAVKDFVDNDYTRWLENLTNIKLDMDIPPQADSQQKLNLMLASGDLPEVIIGCNIRLDQLQILANQGLLLPLDDYIDKYGVEFKQVYEAYPEIKDLITMLDGKIYGLPHVNDCYHCSMAQKMWVYQPWLDKLGWKYRQPPKNSTRCSRRSKSRTPTAMVRQTRFLCRAPSLRTAAGTPQSTSSS